MRLLFFSNLLATPNQHGGCVYPHGILTELHRQGFHIEYAWLGAPLHSGRLVMRDPLVAKYIARGWVRGARKLGPYLVPDTLRGWLGLRPEADDGEHFPFPVEQAFAARLIRRLRPDAVLVDGTCTLPILDQLTPTERKRLHVAVLTHNLNSRRTHLYRENGQPLDFMAMTAEEETALLDRADVVVAIQEREAEAFHTMLPHKPVVTVPMPIRPDPIPPVTGGTPVCLFVGGHSGHNLAGLSWLLRDVWPVVLRECPEARLHVAGTVGQAVPSGTPQVRALGPVEELREAYAPSQVALAPLPMGTGLKIKVIEAMGWGRPVVTTTAGAEGFVELERGELAVVAETPEAFAAAIIRLLRSSEERQRVVSRQLAWIEQRCCPAKAIAPLLEAWCRPVPAGVAEPANPGQSVPCDVTLL
ncbi:MAG TPA: glycosyltransferase family 4 protein [Chthoniobacterales bacterium]